MGNSERIRSSLFAECHRVNCIADKWMKDRALREEREREDKHELTIICAHFSNIINTRRGLLFLSMSVIGSKSEGEERKRVKVKRLNGSKCDVT